MGDSWRGLVMLGAACGLVVAGTTLPLLAAAAPKRTVYAWFPAKMGNWSTDGLDWECLTHLCYRAVVIGPEGRLRTPTIQPPKEFVDAAHRHGVKVTVLVWGIDAANSDSYLARYPEQAAQSLLDYVRENNLDGVNIDDETYRARNAVANAPNRELLTRFFMVLSRKLKAARADYHLTFAAPPVISAADRWGASWMDMAAIAEVVDGIIPMGYTQNPPSIGWATNAEPLGGGGKAPHTTTRDTQTLVRDYLQAMGGRKEKLLLGVTLGFGGFEFRCRTGERLSPTLGRGVPRTAEECREDARRHGERWDEAQQSPWYCYRDGDAFVQGWYNDVKAWQARLDWAKQQELGGLGIWVLDGVADPPERWSLLRSYLGLGGR